MKIFEQILNSKLLTNYSFYITANLISSAIPFIFLPILTRYLSPEHYGIITTFQTLIAIITIFSGLNTHGAVARAFFDLDKGNFKQYVFNTLLVITIGSSIILVLALGVFILEYEFIRQYRIWLILICIASAFESISILLSALWRVQEKPLYFFFFQVSKASINVILSLFLVINLELGWQGRLSAVLASIILFGIFSILFLNRHEYCKISLNKLYIQDALKFGLPLIPHALSGWITTYVDRFFIASMISVADVGIYSVGYQVAKVLGLISVSFNQVWQPYLFKSLSSNQSSEKIKIVKITYLYFLFISALAIGLSLIAPPLLKVFLGIEFHSSTTYIPWIALGYAFDGMYFMVVNYIFFLKKTYYLAVITFLSAIANIFLNYLLINLFGTIGAAQATALTSFLTFIFTWLLCSRIYRMPWNIWLR